MKTLFLALLILAACAEPARIASTPSGRPEATFTATTPSAVAATIAGGCAQLGAVVVEMRDNSVTCTGEMDPGDKFLANLAIGSAYSTSATSSSRFTIFPVGGDVRVQVYQWIEAQSAYGQTRTLEMTGANAFNNGMMFLRSLGGT